MKVGVAMWYGGQMRECLRTQQVYFIAEYLADFDGNLDEIPDKVENDYPYGVTIAGKLITKERFIGMCLYFLINGPESIL